MAASGSLGIVTNDRARCCSCSYRPQLYGVPASKLNLLTVPGTILTQRRPITNVRAYPILMTTGTPPSIPTPRVKSRLIPNPRGWNVTIGTHWNN